MSPREKSTIPRQPSVFSMTSTSLHRSMPFAHRWQSAFKVERSLREPFLPSPLVPRSEGGIEKKQQFGWGCVHDVGSVFENLSSLLTLDNSQHSPYAPGPVTNKSRTVSGLLMLTIAALPLPFYRSWSHFFEMFYFLLFALGPSSNVLLGAVKTASGYFIFLTLLLYPVVYVGSRITYLIASLLPNEAHSYEQSNARFSIEMRSTDNTHPDRRVASHRRQTRSTIAFWVASIPLAYLLMPITIVLFALLLSYMMPYDPETSQFF